MIFNNRFRYQQSPTRLLGTLLAAYWLLAAMALCVPMSVDAASAASMDNTAHHAAMANMPCCEEDNLDTPTLGDCENGVPDSAKLAELQCSVDAPLLQLLFILSEPVDTGPPAFNHLPTSYCSTYPRLHLTLGVQLD
ncbi:hypothetical protein R50073_43230 [Maricurvus nonylphenolicus]|uniref:hypothetical protein n=1 Tax=Maricurvus nonylphenolicus TaxID=1008307 RepID=UPI0036F3545C